MQGAYLELKDAPQEEGYSERAGAGRAQLLEEARAALLGARGRPPAGAAGAGKSLTVAWDTLPGALCLLREVRARAFSSVGSTSAQHVLHSIRRGWSTITGGMGLQDT